MIAAVVRGVIRVAILTSAALFAEIVDPATGVMIAFLCGVFVAQKDVDEARKST